MLIEYKVRPVTRYIITRYETSGPDAKGTGREVSGTRGEYENSEVAYEVAYALCKAEHERMGSPLGDECIRYPEHPEKMAATNAYPSVKAA